MADYTKEEYTCVVRGTPYATMHHVYSRKAHPRLADQETNMIPLCDDLHKEWHSQGTIFMQNKFPKIKKWLLDNGWQFDAGAWKWVNYELLRLENEN